MLSSRHNFRCDQGSTFRRTVRLKSRDTGLYLNLTGYTARMQVRRFIDDTTALFELTTENGGVEIVGVDGTIRLHALPAQTMLVVDEADYDLEVTTPSGDIYTILTGKFRARREATR